MEAINIINNNILSSVDEEGREVIVMGRGLGFQCKPGMLIDENKIEKIFRMDTNGQTRKLGDLLTEIPLEHVEIANTIINEANKIIKKKLNRNLYITLIDHISYAIERCKQGILFTNPLLWEIKKYYPQEYRAGIFAINLINHKIHIELTEDEAASIAMHFVNAELGTDMTDTFDVTKIIQNIIKIVKYHANIQIDEDSLNYDRFLTHLKFFAQRIITNSILNDTDKELNIMIKNHYPKEYKCAEKVKLYLESEYSIVIPDEEITYLTMHIKRISSRN